MKSRAKLAAGAMAVILLLFVRATPTHSAPRQGPPLPTLGTSFLLGSGPVELQGDFLWQAMRVPAGPPVPGYPAPGWVWVPENILSPQHYIVNWDYLVQAISSGLQASGSTSGGGPVSTCSLQLTVEALGTASISTTPSSIAPTCGVTREMAGRVPGSKCSQFAAVTTVNPATGAATYDPLPGSLIIDFPSTVTMQLRVWDPSNAPGAQIRCDIAPDGLATFYVVVSN
jgi:hypothetical protein